MIKEEIGLAKLDCANCHVFFWVSEEHDKRLRESHESFHCPNGHSQVYPGKTIQERLEEAKKEGLKRADEYFDKWQGCKKELKKFKPKETKDKKVNKKKEAKK